jgi:hypothetical protein
MNFKATENKLLIDCEKCTKQESHHCRDCVVTFLCGDTDSTALIINLDEYRSIKEIADAGLVPPLRYSEPIRVFNDSSS